MTEPLKAAVLRDRKIVCVSGMDRVKFLQGLTTNDIRRLAPALSKPCASRIWPSEQAAWALFFRHTEAVSHWRSSAYIMVNLYP